MNGNRPTSGPPTRSNVSSWPRRTYLNSVSSSAGTNSISTTVRGSRRNWRSTRTAVDQVTAAHPPSTSARNAASRSCSPVRPRISSGSPSASTGRSHQDQRVAALGLVQHVARESSVAPSSARRWNISQRSRLSTGSRPIGSSSTSSPGLPTSALASETRDRSPPERAHDLVTRLEVDDPEHLVDPLRLGTDDAREVGEVLARGQVAVHRRRLRHVADTPPQLRRACRGRPSTSTEPRRITWTPTIARIRVVLPDPLGPSSPVTRCSDTSGSPSERVRGAANDVEVGHADRGHAATIRHDGLAVRAKRHADRRRRVCRERPGAAGEATIVSPENYMLFRPLLAEAASATIEPRHVSSRCGRCARGRS